MAMVRPIRSMEYPVIPIIKELPATNTNAFLSTLYKIWLVSYFFYLVYILILSGKTDKGIFQTYIFVLQTSKGNLTFLQQFLHIHGRQKEYVSKV